MIKAENILLVRTDRIGELILTSPALAAVRKHYPRAKITLIVNPSSAEVVEAAPFIDSITKFHPSQIQGDLFKWLSFFRSIKKSRFNLAVIFNPSKFFNILTFMAGIPVRVGYDRKAGFFLTHKIRDKKYLCEKHEVEYNLDLIGTLGIRSDDKSLYFPLSNSADSAIAEILKENGVEAQDRLIAVHAATSNPEKKWPPERFAQICDRLSEEFKIKIVLVGGREEHRTSDEVKSKMHNAVLDLTGALSVKEVGSLLKRCSFLISNDSGPVHISAAVGTPAIVFFGENRPGGSSIRWGPYGDGHLVIGKPKIIDITVEEAYKAIRERISKLCGKR